MRWYTKQSQNKVKVISFNHSMNADILKFGLILLFISLFTYAKSQTLNFEVKDVNNNWVNLEELSGEKLTVIDFWATWCKPCVNALPKINQLNEDYKNQGVNFIGVNVDGPRNQAKVKPFSQSLNLNYAIVLDPDQEVLSELNASVLPTLIVLNSKGKEVYRHEGFTSGDEKHIAEKLQTLLN